MEPRISSITLGVSDLQRAFHFYKDGLGFPTKMTPDGGIILFTTKGTALMLYPKDKLAEDGGLKPSQNGQGESHGFTLGYCARKKEDVDAILAKAEKAGATITKPAQKRSWGGYSGNFADPDGNLWEVLYSHTLKFNSDGSVKAE